MINIGIVGHHTRMEAGETLADKVDAEFMTIDSGGLGPGRNHEKAWQWLEESDSEWSVVLEDDAIPIIDFRKELKVALLNCPFSIVSLYLGRIRPPHWQDSIASVIARPESWLLADELLHHVGVAIQTPLIGDMLNVLAGDHEYVWGKVPIDEAIGRWVRLRGRQVAYANPSLVDHDYRLPTVIEQHVSQHATEPGVRHFFEPRKAWKLGTRRWDRSSAEIPTPSC